MRFLPLPCFLAGEVVAFFFVPLSLAPVLRRLLFTGCFLVVVAAFLLVLYPDKPEAFFLGFTN